MGDYPRAATARAAIRDEIGERGRAAAIGMRLSLKCQGRHVREQHATTPGGCKNTGSNCLCECHDQPTEETTDARRD